MMTDKNCDSKHLVYVVDSDISLRQRLASLLASASMQVEVFANAEEIFTQLGPGRPKCLIIGNGLSGMGLDEVIRGIIRQRLHIPIIVMGEDSDLLQAVKVLRAGAVEFISKPFTDNKMLACVKNVIRSSAE